MNPLRSKGIRYAQIRQEAAAGEPSESARIEPGISTMEDKTGQAILEELMIMYTTREAFLAEEQRAR